MTGYHAAVIDHIAIETTDIERDVTLLTQTLGLFTIRWGTHVLTKKRIAMLADHAGMKLELIETPEPDGSLAHVAFEVPDVEAAATNAVRAGCHREIERVEIPAAMASMSQVRSHASAALQFICYRAGSPDITHGKQHGQNR